MSQLSTQSQASPQSQVPTQQVDQGLAKRTSIFENIRLSLSVRRGSALFLAAIITASTGLSLYWVFTVPIFQAPDEFVHFDYAMNIYSAGRLITAREPLADWNTPLWELHVFTQYLMRECDFNSMQFNTQVKAPPGYGTKAFYNRLDLNAPLRIQVDSHRDRGPVSASLRSIPPLLGGACGLDEGPSRFQQSNHSALFRREDFLGHCSPSASS